MEKAQMTRTLSEIKECGSSEALFAQEILAQIGDKWTMWVIGTLFRVPEHRARFSEIGKLIPRISQRMLTVTLKNLERDGILEREVFPEIPPRVEYELSKFGLSLYTPISGLVDWVVQNADHVKEARNRYDSQKNF